METRTWTRPAWLGLALLLALGLVWKLQWVHPWYEANEETNDGSIYVLCAKALLAGEGYSYLGEPFTVRPPGYSLLLAPWIAWRGVDFALLDQVGWAFGLAGVLCVYALLLPRVGALVACAASAALALNPAWQGMSNQVMADVPGATLALACLLIERWASRRPSARRDVVLAVAIALAAYVRTVNVLLVPAILGARAIERWRAPREGREPPLPWRSFSLRRLALLPLAVAALLLPWSVRCALRHPETPVDQNFLYSYSTGMWRSDPEDPTSPLRPAAEILARVPVRASKILPSLGGRMQRHERDPWLARLGVETSERATTVAHSIAGALLLAALVVVAVRRARTSELFALLVLGVLLVYFGFRDRLAAPVFVLGAAALIELVVAGLQRFAESPRARAATAALVLAVGTLDFEPRKGWGAIEARHAAYVRAARDVRAVLPPDARIASTIGWHWSVYLERPVYSLLFGYRRQGGVRGVEQVIARRGIDHVLFADFVEDEIGLLPALRAKHGELATRGEVTVIRVDFAR